ncbi:MAG: hypothetical protein IPH36_19995 [Saprospiraceae bacterium]|nr:hypothetical protein [Saprospiraceae bacterium]
MKRIHQLVLIFLASATGLLAQTEIDLTKLNKDNKLIPVNAEMSLEKYNGVNH